MWGKLLSDLIMSLVFNAGEIQSSDRIKFDNEL